MPATPSTWLTLVYKVPSEPSRLRASVWRRLKAMGAVYLQNSVAVIPHTTATERGMRALRNEIVEKMSGSAVLLQGTALVGQHDVTALVEDARNDEYEEIRDKCRDFLAGLEKEITGEHFTYGELEENEEDLIKLRHWFDKVVARDLLGAKGRQETVEAIEVCDKALADCAQRVYAAEDV